MSAFPGPALGDVVTLVVPKRERVPALVEDRSATSLDVRLMRAIEMPWRQLQQQHLFVEFAAPEGLSRLTGAIGQRPQDRARIAITSSGECFRIEHHGHIQLLRRSALIAAVCSARMVVIPMNGPDPVASQIRCVAITGTSLRMAGLPRVRRDDVFEFDLYLEEREDPVHGRFAVESQDADGFVEGRLQEMSGAHRSRLVQWASEHATRSVA